MENRKRPLVVSIIAGCLMLYALFAAIVFSYVLLTGRGTINVYPPWILERLGKVGMLAVLLPIFALIGTLSVGLWKLRPWARGVMLCVTGAVIVLYLATCCIVVVRTHDLELGYLIDLLFWAVLFFYFYRSEMKARFAFKE